jgi:hypothetical protein
MRYGTTTPFDAVCTAVQPFGRLCVYTLQQPEYGQIVSWV